MPQIIDVPGLGQVEFPDGMTDDQIAAAIQKQVPPKVDPTEGMSTLDRLRAGFGRALSELDRGARQIAPGAPTQQSMLRDMPPVEALQQNVADVEREAASMRELDAPLMATGAGKVGNLAG